MQLSFVLIFLFLFWVSFVNSQGLTQQQSFTEVDDYAQDNFGNSVSVSGNFVVIGAPFTNSLQNTQQGAAYVFTQSGSTWQFQQKLVANDGNAYDILEIQLVFQEIQLLLVLIMLLLVIILNKEHLMYLFKMHQIIGFKDKN
jgi:hypothetical protein